MKIKQTSIMILFILIVLYTIAYAQISGYEKETLPDLNQQMRYTDRRLNELNNFNDSGIYTIQGGTITGITSMAVTGVTQFEAANDLDVGPYTLTAAVLESDIAIGTAPFDVTSTTVSTNLNADMVDGIHATETELKPLGAWAAKTAATDIEATTDGFLCHALECTGGAYHIKVYVEDGDSTPDVLRGAAYIAKDSDNSYGGICVPVAKGSYYKSEKTDIGGGGSGVANETLFFIPLGI